MKRLLPLFCCLAGLCLASCSQSQPPSKPAALSTPTWKNGPPARLEYFPIAVWLQSPESAPRFKAAGINLFIGLWQGPTESQLAALKQAEMPVVCEQNAVGLKYKNDPIIVGWMHGDEPDNAQPATGGGYGPCIPPETIVQAYTHLKAKDPTRPILLNLGQGVANDEWIGRGSGAKLSDYKTYVKGGDLISFDVYPIAGLEKPNNADYLWYVAKGVERLQEWTGGRKQVWNCIECTRISGTGKATPEQVRSEVWMSLIHGSHGLIYFVHQFAPSFNEHALLDDPPMLAAVTALNRQITALAPILNSPTIHDGAQITSDSSDIPIHLMEKHYHGDIYLFTVGMRNGKTQARIQVPDHTGRTRVEVIGENRFLNMQDGQFHDSFAPYAVHLYRLPSK